MKSHTPTERDELLGILRTRFDSHPERHPGIQWADVLARLDSNPATLRTLMEMERTGGEPDVVVTGATAGVLAFFDCSPETPKGRTSLCYDRAGLESRKEHHPANSAVDLAASMGAELLSETQYHVLQSVGNFDTKTSSWLKTPDDVRALGGALFGDRRFGRVFIYHNGAQSYYAVRGFRCVLAI